MLGRGKNTEALVQVQHMDPELIEPIVDDPLDIFWDDGAVMNAALFATGHMRRLQRSRDVFGLVLAGFSGYTFADDEGFTGLVASELPLEGTGLGRVEHYMDQMVRRKGLGRHAEVVGFIALDEAAVKLVQETKYGLALPYPNEVR